MRCSRWCRHLLLALLLPITGWFAAVGVSPAVAQQAISPPLRWAPPALENPITVQLGRGFTVSRLDPTRDYRIQLPAQRKVGGTVIEGGRNVVIVGGQVTASPNATSNYERRGIYIKGTVGTVHIEGVEIDGAGLPLDGIGINAPEAKVQIQNVHVKGLNGSYAGFHADVVQPWGGVRELRIDRLSGSSNYQGLFLQPGLGPIGSATIQNVDLTHTALPTDRGGYMMWLANGCTTYPMTLSEVYVRSETVRPLDMMVYPSSAAGNTECPALISGLNASWPQLPITGSVTHGSPANGAFVPPGIAGTDYVSPGYTATAPEPAPKPTPEAAPEPTPEPIAEPPDPPTPAKFQVRRGKIEKGHLDVLVDTTAHANGDQVEVTFRANGKVSRFTETIEDARLRFARMLPKAQRGVSSGIMEIRYAGNERVRRVELRLRAASGKAELRREVISLSNGELTAAGGLTQRASGVVRLRLDYDRSDGSVGVWRERAKIGRDGRWSLARELPAHAHAGGYLSIEFTGNYPNRIRGERMAKQLLDGQTFRTEAG